MEDCFGDVKSDVFFGMVKLLQYFEHKTGAPQTFAFIACRLLGAIQKAYIGCTKLKP